jgi:putative membrane protein
MEKKLWTIITTPAMILTLVTGISLLVINPAWLSQGWMHIKLLMVVILLAYHFYTYKIYKELQSGVFKWSSNQLRLWNEGATLLLFAIVFLVVLKNSFSWIWGIIGLILLGLILTLAIRLYRLSRLKKPD